MSLIFHSFVTFDLMAGPKPEKEAPTHWNAALNAADFSALATMGAQSAWKIMVKGWSHGRGYHR